LALVVITPKEKSMKRLLQTAWLGTFTRRDRGKSRGGALRLERLEERQLLDAGPTQFGSAAAFTQYLINTALSNYQNLFGQTFPSYQYVPFQATNVSVPSAFTDAVNVAQAATQTNFSQTNIQVSGVDEGDIVKTDGSYIYEFSQQNLVIVKAGPGTGLALVSHTVIEGTPDVLYLNGTRLTVISSIDNSALLPADPTTGSFTLAFNSPAKIKETVFDVSDPTNPQVIQSVYEDGSYLDSREIGNQIYIVDENSFNGLPAPAYTNFNGEIVYETQDQYLARISGHEIDLALPHFYVGTTAAGGLQSAGLLTDPAQLYQPPSNADNQLLSVFSLDVTSNSTSSLNAVSVLGSYGSTVYASTSHLYLVSPNWSYQVAQADQGSTIFQFALNGPQITQTGSGVVPGQVSSSFWLDEQGAYLRIATTANWGSDAVSSVYILSNSGGALQIVGKLENISPGERVQSVLFLGDHAFVDTSATIDPLFAVDLSTPTAPELLGSLTLPGDVQYLHALDATHLLGVGRGGFDGETLDLSLFDATDLTSLKLINQAFITPQFPNWFWSGSEAEWNHHAVGYFPDSQTLAIPVFGTSYSDATGVHYQSDLWVYHVDFTNGFQLLGQVQHDSQVRRSLVIGDELYSIADNSIQVHPLANPQAPGAEVVTAVDQVNQFLVQLYHDLLNRDPDATGLAAWTTLMIQGTPRSQIVTGFEGSLEYRTDQVQNLYTTLLGRPADASGLNDFVSRLGSGQTIGQVETAILGSDEYFKHAGANNAGFLTSLYHDVLNRAVDASGAMFFGAELASQTSRAAVAASVLSSTEAEMDQLQGFYQSALHRPADNTGLTYFSGIMQHGASSEEVLAAIYGSDEYFGRVQ